MISNLTSSDEVDDDISDTSGISDELIDCNSGSQKKLFIGCGLVTVALYTMIVAILIGYLWSRNKVLTGKNVSLNAELNSRHVVPPCLKYVAFNLEEAILFQMAEGYSESNDADSPNGENSQENSHLSNKPEENSKSDEESEENSQSGDKHKKDKEVQTADDIFGTVDRVEMLKTHFGKIKWKNVKIIIFSKLETKADIELLLSQQLVGVFDEIRGYKKPDQAHLHMITLVASLMQKERLKLNEQVLFVHKNGYSEIGYLLCQSYIVKGKRGLTEDDLIAIEDMVESASCSN